MFGATGSVGTIQKCRDLIMSHAESLSKGLNILYILADILICVYEPEAKKFRIWHIAPDCTDEFLDEMGYACSGLEDTFAYTFLRNYYSSEMEIQKGKLVAYRVIRDAIDIGAYGLGEPVDIWVMKVDGDVQISQLSENETMALNDACLAWKEAEKAVLKV